MNLSTALHSLSCSPPVAPAEARFRLRPRVQAPASSTQPASEIVELRHFYLLSPGPGATLVVTRSDVPRNDISRNDLSRNEQQ